MNDNVKTLAMHRMVRAHEALREGDLLLAEQSARGAVNRFYYAAFYAVRSLLATRGLDSSRHAGVIALFHEHFVKTGTVSKQNARALSRSFEKRQKTDYADFVSVTIEEALAVRQGTHVLIEECEAVLHGLVTQQ